MEPNDEWCLHAFPMDARPLQFSPLTNPKESFTQGKTFCIHNGERKKKKRIFIESNERIQGIYRREDENLDHWGSR